VRRGAARGAGVRGRALRRMQPPVCSGVRAGCALVRGLPALPGLRRVLVLALLLSIALGARPSFAAAPFDFTQLMRSFAQVKSAEAEFVEVKTLSIMSKPLETSGVLRYRAPSHLEKRTLRPRLEVLIVDGDALSIEQGGRTRKLALGDYPAVGAFIESIRGTLAGDAAALTHYYETRVDGDRSSWVLTLVPRDRQMSDIISTVRLTGTQALIQRIEMFETGGDKTTMTIREPAR